MLELFNLDDREYKYWQKELDIMIVAANYTEGKPRDNSIKRNEFVEILVRVAELRYIKNGTCTKYGVALK